MENNISIFTKIISIFWEPKKTFEALSNKVTLLDIFVPIILISIVAMICLPYTIPLGINAQKAKIEQSERISEEKKEEILYNMDEGKGKIIAYFTTPIGIIFGIVFLALIFWFIGNFIIGGDRQFMEMWALASYLSLIDIIASAVKIPLMVQKNSLNVYTSLAIFMNESSTYLFRFIKAVDIFGLWKVIVVSIGLSVLYKKKFNRVLIIIIIAWLVYCLIAAAFSGLIGL